MRNRISAIIIDKDHEQHDYSEVKFNGLQEHQEKEFDIKILESGENILHEIYWFRGADAIITIGDEADWGYLNQLPFMFRKKWAHLAEFNPLVVAAMIISVFKGNIERAGCPISFSFFTCTHNTGVKNLARLYQSMVLQTYNEWNWFIIDDSDDDETAKLIESAEDPRITVIKNVSIHGNIGFNKRAIAMLCDGDYLVEVDHDDELTPDCLEHLLYAMNEFPDTDFFYSRCLELKEPDEVPIIYGEKWGWGEGKTCTETINGKKYTYSETPDITPFSIRTIYAQPNHLRCWEREFYHKIGGHNPEMSVLDDQELIIRTFLKGKITKIEKCLYIQHEGAGERGENQDNAQSKRFAEIQRTTILLKDRFDEDIHNRIIELGHNDTAWDDNFRCSNLYLPHEKGAEKMNNSYIP